MKILLSRTDGLLLECIELDGVHTIGFDIGFLVVTFKDEDAYEQAQKKTGWFAWDEYGLSLEMPLHNGKTKIHDLEYSVWLE